MSRGSLAILLLISVVVPAHSAQRRTRDASGTSRTFRVVSGAGVIGTICTARGLTTMLSLPDEAREAICGDLYDPATNSGGFVIQRSGRDLFVKPLRASGHSNLFVKTDRATYAFDLTVGPPTRAMRIVYVDDSEPLRTATAERKRLADERSALERERAEFGAEQRRALERIERARSAAAAADAERAERMARSWIESEMAGTGALLAVRRPRVRTRSVEVTLGEAALAVAGRTYLRCTVRGLGRDPIDVATAEIGGARRRVVEAKFRVAAGGSATRLLVFDGALARGDTLRLLDASGRELAYLEPFE